MRLKIVLKVLLNDNVAIEIIGLVVSVSKDK